MLGRKNYRYPIIMLFLLASNAFSSENAQVGWATSSLTLALGPALGEAQALQVASRGHHLIQQQCFYLLKDRLANMDHHGHRALASE